jgi:cytochrome c5
MTENQIQAGSSVESVCRKCKAVTDHHVVAMMGDKIAKVECKVCRARHAYVSPKAETKAAPAARVRSGATGVVTPAPRAAKPAKSSAATRQAMALTAQWEKLVSDSSTPLEYSMDRAYRVGDIIDHPVFGPGHVQKVMKPCTIEVMFKDAVRNLRCGRLT